jgi:hypothetical protein
MFRPITTTNTAVATRRLASRRAAARWRCQPRTPAPGQGTPSTVAHSAQADTARPPATCTGPVPLPAPWQGLRTSPHNACCRGAQSDKDGCERYCLHVSILRFSLLRVGWHELVLIEQNAHGGSSAVDRRTAAGVPPEDPPILPCEHADPKRTIDRECSCGAQGCLGVYGRGYELWVCGGAPRSRIAFSTTSGELADMPCLPSRAGATRPVPEEPRPRYRARPHYVLTDDAQRAPRCAHGECQGCKAAPRE